PTGRFRDQIRSDLRVVHPVAAANREPRIAVRVPAEAHPRREIRGGIGQRLAVVPQPEVEREAAPPAEAVLGDPDEQPLLQLVAGDAVADRLCVLLHVRQRQLIERSGRGVAELEGAEYRGSGLTAL